MYHTALYDNKWLYSAYNCNLITSFHSKRYQLTGKMNHHKIRMRLAASAALVVVGPVNKTKTLPV